MQNGQPIISNIIYIYKSLKYTIKVQFDSKGQAENDHEMDFGGK